MYIILVSLSRIVLRCFDLPLRPSKSSILYISMMYTLKKIWWSHVWKKERKYWKPKTISRLKIISRLFKMFSRRSVSIDSVERLGFSFLFFGINMMLFYYMWGCKVLCFTDIKLWTQRYVYVDFSFGLHCKNKECGVSRAELPSLPGKTSRIFPVSDLEGISWAVPLGCCKGLTRQAWDVQTLHFPKKGLTLDCLLRDNL